MDRADRAALREPWGHEHAPGGQPRARPLRRPHRRFLAALAVPPPGALHTSLFIAVRTFIKVYCIYAATIFWANLLLGSVLGTVEQDASHWYVVRCSLKKPQQWHAEADAHGRCRTTSTATTTRSTRTCSARTQPCASTRACRAAGSTATSTSTWCAVPASGFGVLGCRLYKSPAACAETLACRAFVHCYQHTCMAPFTASDL